MTIALDNNMPIIGVSGQDPLASYGTSSMMAQLKAAGVYPVILPHDASRAEELLAGLDGLVVLGNPNDIDPRDYGQENTASVVPETNEYKNRMAFEKAIVEAALAKGIPFLGVCGGMQRMNIGGDEKDRGTLIQNVEDHRDLENPFTPVQFIRLQEDSRLAEMAKGVPGYFAPVHAELPEGVILENSLHHQAVGKIREGFRPAAIAPDGVVEAIEPAPGGKFSNQWALGVQWHPEVATSPVSQAIIRNFVAAARVHQPQHDHLLPQEMFMPTSVISHLQKGAEHIKGLFPDVTLRHGG